VVSGSFRSGLISSGAVAAVGSFGCGGIWAGGAEQVVERALVDSVRAVFVAEVPIENLLEDLRIRLRLRGRRWLVWTGRGVAGRADLAGKWFGLWDFVGRPIAANWDERG
jgi:hypothetical protein